MSKLKLALLSSYSEACANASYARSLEGVLKNVYDVTVFDLRTLEIMRPQGRENVQIADDYIERIAAQLPSFDIVNIQYELGLYGHTVEQIERRLKILSEASKNVIYSVHSITTDLNDFTKAHMRNFEILKSRPPSQPYHIIAHVKRDKERLMTVYDIPAAKITDFPILFLTEEQRRHYIDTASPKEWKLKHGYKEDDIVIGRYGFFGEYKEYISGLKALTLLPPNYKMAFVGGQHPHTIEKMKMSPTIKEITDFIDEYDEKQKHLPSYVPGQTPLLSDRVTFFGGGVSDDELYQAVANIDFALIAYYEAGQSGSAITSLALELCRPSLMSYNFTFMEYEKYFPDSFEYFNIGNHHELKHKILNFDFKKSDRLAGYMARYTMSRLVEMYSVIYDKMRASLGEAVPVSVRPKRRLSNDPVTALARQCLRRPLWMLDRLTYYVFRPHVLGQKIKQLLAS